MKKGIKNTVKIKQILPHGAIKELAALSDTSVFTVSRVLQGKSTNKKVIDAITQYLSTLKAKEEGINSLVDALQSN